VGMRGMRVKNVMRELKNEKIDIIPYSADPVELLQNALSPIEIRKISVNPDDKVISIVVDDEAFAATLGKRGMNVKLNSELIGYDLEVQKMTDYRRAMSIQKAELAASEDPSLDVELKKIDGLNSLSFQHLVEEGLNTPRALLLATPEKLASVPGITVEIIEKFLDQIQKQRM
jgi:transcription termination/antitermination protein NusA